MSETSTATKSPTIALNEALAELTRAEQAVAKAQHNVRDKRLNVLRMQSKDMGNSLADANVNKVMADLEQSDADRGVTLATQRAAKAAQNVDYCQRKFATELRESRTINAQVA